MTTSKETVSPRVVITGASNPSIRDNVCFLFSNEQVETDTWLKSTKHTSQRPHGWYNKFNKRSVFSRK